MQQRPFYGHYTVQAPFCQPTGRGCFYILRTKGRIIIITELNFAKLTPAAWSIATATNYGGVDNGRDLLLHNIREGRTVHPAEENLPEEYVPDYAALKPQYEAIPKGRVLSSANVWHRTCRANYRALTELWADRDYAGMVELMEAAADPGPVSGPARDEWEEAREDAGAHE